MITYVVFFNITLPKFMLVYQKKIDSEVYLFLNLKLEYFCEYKLFYTVNRSPMSLKQRTVDKIQFVKYYVSLFCSKTEGRPKRQELKN